MYKVNLKEDHIKPKLLLTSLTKPLYGINLSNQNLITNPNLAVNEE